VGLIALVALLAACGGEAITNKGLTNKETHKVVPKGKRLLEVGGSDALIGFPEDFVVPADAQIQITSAENPAGLPYGNPASAYLAIPNTDVASVVKFFRKNLRDYETEPCNERVRDTQGVYSQTVAFQKDDPNAQVEGAGYILVIRGDPGITLALLEFNKTIDQCADALYRINKRLYPNTSEENA
jgi:hypothetical protein